MTTRRKRTLWLTVCVVLAPALLRAPSARLSADSRSTALVHRLTTLLDAAKLNAVAARLPESPDVFVAALYIPGQQLIVVSGKYAVPQLLNEKIVLKRYRDAYLDIYSATDPASRRIVEDVKADGLQALRTKNEGFDTYTGRGRREFDFDGAWKRRRVSEQDYMATFQRADDAYVTMLEALVSELSPADARSEATGSR